MSVTQIQSDQAALLQNFKELSPLAQHQVVSTLLGEYQGVSVPFAGMELHFCRTCNRREIEIHGKGTVTDYLECNGDSCDFEICKPCFQQAHPEIGGDALEEAIDTFLCSQH